MADPHALLLIPALALAAAAWASVGHGGASAYWLVFALAGLSLAPLKPAVLILNVIVSSLSLFHFTRSSAFDYRTFFALALGSLPFAWWGGRMPMSEAGMKILIATMLLFSAWRLLTPRVKAPHGRSPMPFLWGPPIGAVLGLVAGLTGTGGGALLSPLLILVGWNDPKSAAGVSAAFILVNSMIGLPVEGILQGSVQPFRGIALAWIPAVILGGFLGSRYGSRREFSPLLRPSLALILLAGVAKLILI